jgi:RNA polymerase sigma factor (sigma-70 family)
MDNDDRSSRLLSLLAPCRAAAIRTARRLSRSNADGDDLFHDAVFDAYRGLHTLRDESRFRAWFFSILLRLGRRRRWWWRDFLPLRDVAEPTSEGDGDDDRAAWLRRALQKLAPLEREALVMAELEGFTIAEIAESQASTVTAVKTRISRAKKRLRERYVSTGFARFDAAAAPAQDANDPTRHAGPASIAPAAEGAEGKGFHPERTAVRSPPREKS